MFPKLKILLSILAGGLLLSACSAPPAPSTTATLLPTRSGALTPFLAPVATITPPPVNDSTPTPLPSPTPTPRTHVVKKGEDMGGIAFLYHVTLQDLMAANPTVSPNMMSVGTVLTIPYSQTPDAPQGPQATSQPATPTPIPLEAGQLNCSQTQEGGAWCFLPIHNPHDFALEGVSAVIRAADKDAKKIVPLSAFLPLDVLPAGASLPVSAYFPPEQLSGLSAPHLFSAELVSALPSRDDGRYLPAEVKGQKVLISEDGLSAEIQLDVSLSQAEGAAQTVRVAAVAYDIKGNVIGVRRWENDQGQALQSGKPYPVVMHLYSTAGSIDHVTLAAEARP